MKKRNHKKDYRGNERNMNLHSSEFRFDLEALMKENYQLMGEIKKNRSKFLED